MPPTQPAPKDAPLPHRGKARRSENDLLAAGRDALSPLERAQIRFIRRTLRPGPLDRTVRALQATVGQWWILAATQRLRHVHGLERLPPLGPSSSVILVANHRSFFDLYVATAVLVSNGMPLRILFPVRSTFFYDHPLGPLVNGLMSFFAMYPPIFRDRKRAALNLASLGEAAELLQRGGFFVGLHPEGTRNTGGDPYTLLPPQSGVGRLIRAAIAKRPVPVVPVFVNGLGNDLPRQVASGVTGRGAPIHVVFGAPVDFGALASAPDIPATHKRIAEACLTAIRTLGEEEKVLRSST
jgi:1-acyl-sn-glycerol-3-phosphate acyltransferase